ncbi:methyl-accepting chemotaxis protein, partial [Butyricicoccus sp. 1XD8-22]
TFKPLNTLGALMGQVSEGDLSVHINVKSKDEIGTLAEHFNQMVSNIKNIIRVVTDSSNHVEERSHHLSSMSEETSASSIEVSKAVNQIAIGATTSSENADAVTEASAKLGEKINEITNQGTVVKKTGLLFGNISALIVNMEENFNILSSEMDGIVKYKDRVVEIIKDMSMTA